MGLLDKMRSGASARTPVTKGKYGIDQAAELLRSLPTENMDLVITVVKKTLQSFDVDIGQIVNDANTRLKKIDSEIERCEKEIVKFRKEVEEREGEIEELKERHAETSMIKEHLEEVLDSREEPIPEEFRAPKTKDESGVRDKKKDSSATKPDSGDSGDDEPPKSKSAFFKRKGT